MIAITWPKYKYIGGDIQVSQLVLWEKYVWLSDYWIKVNRKPTGLGGRRTIFGNNRNNTALLERGKKNEHIIPSGEK